MYIFVQTVDSKRKEKLIVSKKATVEDLKKIVSKTFEVELQDERLFFRGKQLVDSFLLVDYGINLNDVVQLFIKGDINDNETSFDVKTLKPKEVRFTPKPDEKSVPNSKYYKVNDIVDIKDLAGNWIPAKIKGIFVKSSQIPDECDGEDCHFVCEVLDTGNEETCTSKSISPYARNIVSFDSVKEGDVIVANYCSEDPNRFGHWYSCIVRKIITNRRQQSLKVDLVLSDAEMITGCVIKFTDFLYQVEALKPVAQRTEEEDKQLQSLIPGRDSGPDCMHCKDVGVKCKYCGCQVCLTKSEPDKLILCDECDLAFHIWCLDPPLEEIPTDEYWYCHNCKNDENEIVKAGEGVKVKKRSTSDNRKSKRDWGKGMACVGRTSECTLVGKNHFGPIPGVEVGMSWKFRFQVSEAGVHRPMVAGIHGRESDGAYSIVLSGGYEDDEDNGDKFMYTGSGGRDLSNNQRTAEQSSNQTLTRMNKALALNCNTPFNDEAGATSKDWKNGKPVRVVRNFKLRKHSKYAPEEGNRYDGIYKVIRYYPEKGKSGFFVWRFELQRDDPTPAPWTKQGKDLIASLGLQTIYPEGYETKENITPPKKEKKKRVRNLETPEKSPPNKKVKQITEYLLPSDIENYIKIDKSNEKLWVSARDFLNLGKQRFLKEVEGCFMCICCQDLVSDPITTPCNHNFCRMCLERSFEAEVYTCPSCRFHLGNNFTIIGNENLNKVLLFLFPGYNLGR